MKQILFYLLLSCSVVAQPVIDLNTIVQIGDVTASISKDSCIVVTKVQDPEQAINMVCLQIKDENFVNNELTIQIANYEWIIIKMGQSYYFDEYSAVSIARLRCIVRDFLKKTFLE